MNKLITTILVATTTVVIAEVEYGSLHGSTQSVIVEVGETFTVLANNFNALNLQDIEISFPPDYTTTVDLDFYIYNSDASGQIFTKNNYIENAGIIVGPCKVRLLSAARYCSYKVTKPDAMASSTPMNIISLPDDNNGDVELLIESSTDLQSWTPVYSGSAGMSNNAAFIRTRLIQN